MSNKTIKGITNSQMRKLVESKTPFVNGNKTVIAYYHGNGCYVVNSYGAHYPMVIWEPVTNMWFINEDGSSRTTNRHKSLCRPYNTTMYDLSTTAMKRLSYEGYNYLVAQRILGYDLLELVA